MMIFPLGHTVNIKVGSHLNKPLKQKNNKKLDSFLH